MTDKPDTPRWVRVSKPPPPIVPINTKRNVSPDLPPALPPPNWGKWAYMRDIEIWEAVALTLNFEPDQLPVYLGAFDKLGDDPFRICPTLFLERLLVANSNCGISLGFKPVHELKARCLVDLPEFSAWAVKLNIPNLPPELVALVAPSEQLAPAQNTATPAPVVLTAIDEPVKPAAAAWSVKTSITRWPGYRDPLYKFLQNTYVTGKACPKAQDVLNAWKLAPPLGLRVITSKRHDELEYELNKGHKKTADLKAIQAAIDGLVIQID